MLIDVAGDARELRPDLHGAARDPSRPPPGAASDWTVPQQWDRFTKDEHDSWSLLFERQQEMLAGRAVKAFHEGLEILKLSRRGIPDFAELNIRLEPRTGWRVVAVPGLVPDDVFFRHLSHRQFPAGNFIRPRTQLDYIEEPDVFHDVFGHVPMLADPLMSDWIQRLGAFGAEAAKTGTMALLARLYWRTVEFGLAREDGQLRILGAGILSSHGESIYSLESSEPKRRPFDIGEVLKTPYRSDALQECYFVIDDLDALIGKTSGLGWGELVAKELSE